MSNSAPQTRSAESRRRLAILWGIIAGFIILVLLLLGFCTNDPDPDPPGVPIATVPTTVSPSASKPVVGPSGSTSPTTTAPTTRPAVSVSHTTTTATHTEPPKGGPDTGGGSTAPSGVVLFAVGLVILLSAVGATVQAFRPRRPRP
jgi:hypothetical protein